jgi:twitching motility protein PilT
MTLVARSPESLRLARAAVDLGSFTVGELHQVTGINPNTIYGFSSRLQEVEGLATTAKVKGEEGPGRPRKRFTLTPEGSARLAGEAARVAAALVGEAERVPDVGSLAGEIREGDDDEEAPAPPWHPFQPEIPLQLGDLLREATLQEAEKVVLQVGRPPFFGTGESFQPVASRRACTSEELESIAASILAPYQATRLRELGHVEAGFSVRGVGRFVGEVFSETGGVGMVWRALGATIPSLHELKAERLRVVAGETHGLALVLGASLLDRARVVAAVLEEINVSRSCEVASLRRPLTFQLRSKRSLFHHLEIGVDAPSFAAAIQTALHAGVHVVSISELADRDTAAAALDLAEDRLVLAEMPSLDVELGFEQICERFPRFLQPAIAQRLGHVLRWVIRVPGGQEEITTLTGEELTALVERLREEVQRQALEPSSRPAGW